MAEPAGSETIRVEVVYATPQKQRLVSIEVPEGTTALEAIELSGIRSEFDDLVVDANALGVFSQKVSPEYVLQAEDRVEIYRPLIADPKEIRRQRAREQK